MVYVGTMGFGLENDLYSLFFRRHLSIILKRKIRLIPVLVDF